MIVLFSVYLLQIWKDKNAWIRYIANSDRIIVVFSFHINQFIEKS